VVDVSNKHAASIFSAEIFYSENGGAEHWPQLLWEPQLHIKNLNNLQTWQKHRYYKQWYHCCFPSNLMIKSPDMCLNRLTQSNKTNLSWEVPSSSSNQGNNCVGESQVILNIWL
jgi:hypothetical protein